MVEPMFVSESRQLVVINSALITRLCLIGALFISALLGELLFHSLRGHPQMVMVFLLSTLAASLAAGGVIGLLLTGRREV